MKAEHHSYAEQLFDVMNLRQAGMIRQNVDQITPLLWSVQPKACGNHAIIKQLYTENLIMRYIAITRRDHSEVGYLTSQRIIQQSTTSTPLALFEQIHLKKDEQWDDTYTVLPSGFIIPRNGADDISEPIKGVDAFHIHGLLLSMLDVLETWS